MSGNQRTHSIDDGLFHANSKSQSYKRTSQNSSSGDRLSLLLVLLPLLRCDAFCLKSRLVSPMSSAPNIGLAACVEQTLMFIRIDHLALANFAIGLSSFESRPLFEPTLLGDLGSPPRSGLCQKLKVLSLHALQAPYALQTLC